MMFDNLIQLILIYLLSLDNEESHLPVQNEQDSQAYECIEAWQLPLLENHCLPLEMCP